MVPFARDAEVHRQGGDAISGQGRGTNPEPKGHGLGLGLDKPENLLAH
ncbi:hypothetical protein UVI_02029860 [Ustilaginoidea virens]|uniref:Uncharacterized protein n=1 Tax=Ustilaginoidea virens TaxID=1159556 RepID=A0A1B5L5J3_USTVR|nr:hypothetical protein UVI_02029860 [Ustilaginoidea virens]